MTFRVGQKVVCVKERPHTFANPQPTMPKIGQVYTVRAIYISPRTKIENIHLIEIVNDFRKTDLDGYGEPAFGAWRFSPLNERKTDISVFTKILDDVNGMVTA